MKHNWEYKPLGGCFSYIKNGANIKQSKDAGGFPITRIETLSNGVFNRDRVGFADITVLSIYKNHILQNGDLLMSHINSKTYVGRTVKYSAKPNEVFIHGMNLLRLIPYDWINSQYFYYFTNSYLFKSKIINIRKDAVNQSSFSISDLKKIPTPVPPMEVQEQIVAELDKINELIEQNRELLRHLDSLTQSLFYNTFGDPVSNPKGWPVNQMRDVAPSSSSSKTPEEKDGRFWLLNLDQIESNSGRVLSKQFYENGDIGNSVTTFDNENILYSKLRPYLNKVVIPYSNGFCTSELIPLRPKKHMLNRFYCAHALRLPEFVRYISDKTGGAKMPRVKMDYFWQFNMPIPPLYLQEQFATQIEAIEAQKATIEKSIAELQTLLDSRMDYWFN